MGYYLGGYYLVKLRPAGFGNIKGQELLTASSCINDSLYDDWSLSWTKPLNKQIQALRDDLQIDEERQKEIQEWADEKFEQDKIGWLEVFLDYEAVEEFSERFFSHIKDKVILKILFPEDEANSFISEFKPLKEDEGRLGLFINLSRRIEDSPMPDEEFLGYDLIGVESGGSFHTFHCHDLANELATKFGVQINKYGLIEGIDNPTEIVEYMNDEENGFEPVPWFLVKVIKIK